MSRPRFCELIDMPDRAWRRWQVRARTGDPARRPWPQPVVADVEAVVATRAEAHPGWGHRKVWAASRH
jgi:putative transposase